MSNPPSSPIPVWLGALPAAVHRWVVAARNRSFDRGRGVVTLDRPVLSVGNISVGGTGKTPLSLLILRWLIDAGRKPAVAMRGYGNPGGRESDEAQLYLRAFPELPLVAQPNRLAGLLQLFGTSEPDSIGCVLLDDGFQHRRIARQADIVVLDATRPPHTDRLLPAGWLREPLTSLARASAVVITHASRVERDQIARIKSEIARVKGPALVAVCDHEWCELLVAGDGADERREVSWLRGRRVVATSAIGNPSPFLSSLRAAGADVRAEITLPDHDPYAPPTVARIREAAARDRAEAIVCTEKDWSKLARSARAEWPCPVVRPRVQMKFREGEEELSAHVLEVASRTID